MIALPLIARPLKRLFAAGLLATAASWACAQSLQVSTATELRAGPALNAKNLVSLTVGTMVQQLEVRGGWLRVQVQGQEGWLRSTHVRALSTAAPAAQNPLTGLSGVFSASSNRPTATTGTRGLTAEQLANAQPAPAEVQRMESFAATAAQAQQFAKNGKLQVQSFAPYDGAQP
ncbi:SH3 domain-containing protein [Acidovorax sp. HDW3]|uniref:SH3 domain-containing protein n=1 Tax=Acidovorax sp. HDW3 TaxID=2714923 RepID=UPI001407C98B|nr:SH3 domain-containing protein [Acidovorax sp. HDW3]QIL44100.1 SH3 domain-containing protein [Acidovorax sp. HDW3]